MIVAGLQGLQGDRRAYGQYAELRLRAGSDKNIADIVNYIRTAWKKQGAGQRDAQLVASSRANSNVGAAGSEAARDFDCPRRSGSGGTPDALQTAAQANFSLGRTIGAFLDQPVDELVSSLRTSSNQASPTRR